MGVNWQRIQSCSINASRELESADSLVCFLVMEHGDIDIYREYKAH